MQKKSSILFSSIIYGIVLLFILAMTPALEVCECKNNNCVVRKNYIFKESTTKVLENKNDIIVMSRSKKRYSLYYLEPVFSNGYLFQSLAKNDEDKIKNNENITICKYNAPALIFLIFLLITVFQSIKSLLSEKYSKF